MAAEQAPEPGGVASIDHCIAQYNVGQCYANGRPGQILPATFYCFHLLGCDREVDVYASLIFHTTSSTRILTSRLLRQMASYDVASNGIL